MSAQPIHVYIVEDDPAQRDLLARYLEREGLQVTVMAGAEEMLRRVQRLRPDLVVLDLGLPGLGGLQACQRLRLDGDPLPIIVLTARSGEIDRVMGLESGADDYLTKPFSARELLARIRAVLRRTGAAPRAEAQAGRAPVGEWQLVFDERCLQRQGERRALNTVEFALLAELVRNPGRALSRERLVAVSHPRGGGVAPRAIDMAMLRLRRIVEADPANPALIRTVRGEGYMFTPAAVS